MREAGFGRRGPYPCIGRSGRGFRGGGLLFLLFMLFGAAVPLHARGEDPRPDPRCGTGAGKTGTLARWPPQTLHRGRSRSHSLPLVLGRWGEFAPSILDRYAGLTPIIFAMSRRVSPLASRSWRTSVPKSSWG
jgi:hypothetical protein